MTSAMRPSIRTYFTTPAAHILLIILLGALAYGNSLHVPFVFDDYPNIVENRQLGNVSSYVSSLGWTSFSAKYRWFSLVTFAANIRYGGMSVTGFHVINILIHLCTGITLYYLSQTTLAGFGKDTQQRYALTPLLASLFFVLHPVNTQAVTYIVQRMTSLATLLFLLTILIYARIFCDTQSPGLSIPLRSKALYCLALLCAVLAISSKEISVTLPLVIALYDFVFLKSPLRARLIRLTPFFICMAIMPFYLFGLQGGLTAVAHGGGDDLSTPLPRLTYLLTESRVFITYLRLLLVPVQQNIDYLYPVFTSLLQTQVLLSLAALLLLLLAALYLLAYSHRSYVTMPALPRICAFAILWLFITMSVESIAVPLLDTIAEHRLYLPSLWLHVGAALLLSELLQYAATRHVTAVVTLVLVSALAFGTYQRNRVWQSRVTLWADSVAKAPQNLRAVTNLAKCYADQLEPDKAISLLTRVIAIKPDYAIAHYALGLAYVQKNNVEQALTHYVMATRINPKNSKGWEEAGQLYFELGNLAEARVFLQRAYELDPWSLTPQERQWLSGFTH